MSSNISHNAVRTIQTQQ